MSVSLPPSETLLDAHSSATDDVNRWRGHCIEKFARLEAEMVTALAALRAHPDGAAIRPPSLFGQHVEAIARAVDPEGPFAKAGAKLSKALAACRDDLARRNILIHAQGSVWIDHDGNWLWRYSFRSPAKGKPLEIGAIHRDEAYALEQRLAREINRLGMHLRNLAAVLAKPPAD